jgi:hypothetical protein
LLLLDGKEELELWGKFFFGVKSVGEVDSSDAAVSVYSDSESFDIVAAVGSAGEV